MGTWQHTRFCVREFIKTESPTAVQRAFRLRFNIQPATTKSICRWNHQFEQIGCLCEGKISGRPRVSEENVRRIQESFERRPRKSTRRASRELGIPQPTVWSVLRRHLLFNWVHLFESSCIMVRYMMVSQKFWWKFMYFWMPLYVDWQIVKNFRRVPASYSRPNYLLALSSKLTVILRHHFWQAPYEIQSFCCLVAKDFVFLGCWAATSLQLVTCQKSEGASKHQSSQLSIPDERRPLLNIRRQSLMSQKTEGLQQTTVHSE